MGIGKKRKTPVRCKALEKERDVLYRKMDEIDSKFKDRESMPMETQNQISDLYKKIGGLNSQIIECNIRKTKPHFRLKSYE